MQLIILSISLFLLVLCQDIKAQVINRLVGSKSATDTLDQTEIMQSVYEKPDWKTIDINFLSSYYNQDGNNAAVTGGIGTELLTDFTQKIIVGVPISPRLKLNVDGGYDYYSSASTDNIDNIRSSDSSSDMRVHGNIGASYDISARQSVGFRLGGSGEYDYTSINGGLTYDWESKTRNTALGFSAQAFIDKWKFYFPSELRGQGRLLPTENRQSFNASISIAQVVNKKMQLAVQLEATYMKGLLSTPFHRVYFQEQNLPKVERLPSSRLKIPIGVRVNSYLTDWLVSRFYYRYYWDNWGVNGHTASLELPIKMNRFISVYPMYRYHTQSGSEYFLPYKQHTLDRQYYTSDYDLSSLSSHSVGVGLSIAPSAGLARIKVPFTRQSSIVISGVDLKLSHYMRSTGLKANIISVGVKIEIR